MGRIILLLCFIVSACISSWVAPSDLSYMVVRSGEYSLVTYQRISDSTSPIHIYIEGDGASFDSRGRPSSDPTPTGTFVRDLVARDPSPNVVYLARPCQYIMSRTCRQSDWTDGRFSHQIIDSMADAVSAIAQNRPVVLIGYSGGAMISGLIINNYPSINVQKWVTIAGVLRHSDWTEYFGDMPLLRSMDMNELPKIPQVHYIAFGDQVVPNHLSRKWVSPKTPEMITNATHTYFPNLNIEF